MGSILLRGEIQEVGVLFNGDRNDPKLRKKLDRLEGSVAKARRSLRQAESSGTRVLSVRLAEN